MSIDAFLADLSQRRVTLWKDRGNIRFKCDEGGLSQLEIDQIREYKLELLSRVPEKDTGIMFPNTKNINDHPAKSFDLSPMQEAYWIGEQSFYNNSCVAFYYQRYEVNDLDIERLQSAISVLIKKHSALRLAFNDQGQQIFLKETPYYVNVFEIDVPDVGLDSYFATDKKQVENTFSGIDYPWPFVVSVHKIASSTYVSLSFRLIVADGASLNILLTDLTAFYNDKNLSFISNPTDTALFYRDYINFLADRKNTNDHLEAKEYWSGRLANLPPSPGLPLSGKKNKNSTFQRLQYKLEPATWRALQILAQSEGLTINTVLLSIFCDVLNRFSRSAQFTLNILVSDRPIDLPGFDTLVGNCSSTMLLEVDCSQANFIARCESIRDQIFADLAFSSVSGVELIRELQKARGANDQPLMPVVFTSGLDLHQGSNDFCINDENWQLQETFLKTPQVWLDHQVYQEFDRLVCNWDFLPEVFANGVIEQMFEVYVHWLKTLASDARYWHQPTIDLPGSLLFASTLYNQTMQPLPVRRLHDGFTSIASLYPERIALKERHREISYGTLYRWAAVLARKIQMRISGQSNIVAVYARKGVDQICAVLAVLMSGNSYLPIDSKIPPNRARQILNLSNAKLVLADSNCRPTLYEMEEFPCIEIPLETNDIDGNYKPSPVAIESLAYVIYTSGSTGAPKGVSISHLGAMNTIEDVIRRFNLTPCDSVLALSSINFDLSVYDMFATLSVGASLVIPDEQLIPDPDNWCSLLSAHPITVWNSVPALLEMTLEYLGNSAAQLLTGVRLLLLSGDWIPLTLIEKMRAVLNKDHICVAMGGATEASIWSNYYLINASLPTGWNSVPYGVPLSNQTMLVLNSNLEECPDWVEGDLYIGGHGLALEYLNDPEKTAQSFITHPLTGSRLYRTGDLARNREGLIEFLGRKDFQVKIRGYRIELKEIEANIETLEAVRQSAVIVDQAGTSNARIIAFYTLQPGLTLSEAAINQHLGNTLPAYMLPNHYQLLPELPLSSNGKIDRKILSMQVVLQSQNETTIIPPKNEVESTLLTIWEKILENRIHSIKHNFFECGGNSLLAVRLVRQIEENFLVKLQLGRLFELNTIELLSVEIKKQQTSVKPDQKRLCLLNGGNHIKDVVFIHPVGGGIFSYLELASELKGVNVYGLECLDTDHCNGLTMEETIQIYANTLTNHGIGKTGAINLAGWSMGGVFAIALCKYFEQRGQKVNPPLLIDPWVANPEKRTQFTVQRAIQGFFNDIMGESLADITCTIPNNLSLIDSFDAVFESSSVAQSGRLLDQSELRGMFLLYYRNSIILREFNLSLPSIPCYLMTAGNNNTFDSLKPIKDEFPNLRIELNKHYNQCNHWNIMTNEILTPFAMKWFKQVVING